MTHYSMFLHNVSCKLWVLKTITKFSDDDVNVGILMQGWHRRKCATEFCPLALHPSRLSFSVSAKAQRMQNERRDIMDDVSRQVSDAS